MWFEMETPGTIANRNGDAWYLSNWKGGSWSLSEKKFVVPKMQISSKIDYEEEGQRSKSVIYRLHLIPISRPQKHHKKYHENQCL